MDLMGPSLKFYICGLRGSQVRGETCSEGLIFNSVSTDSYNLVAIRWCDRQVSTMAIKVYNLVTGDTLVLNGGDVAQHIYELIERGAFK